ncbi:MULTISPECIES: hypothetical protein [Actinomyces]|uniref:Hemagglutinin n=1 Tax=Actinomyces respiraculi TaxID=2744574 RepID=A0A7T0LK39_9ACTO|nr:MULTISPECIES: hypothetical protein [Actinomyces]QPL05227.1 hypothetical protein ID810_10985 [Actinomyces respiraculi]
MRPAWVSLERTTTAARTTPSPQDSTAEPDEPTPPASSAAALFDQAESHPRPGRRPGRLRRRLTGALIVLLALAATFGAGALAIDALGLLDPRTEPTAAAPTPNPSVHTPTKPAIVVPDYTGFDPAHVIDDDVFFDSSSMTLEEVTAFIDRVNKGCTPGDDGTPCLSEAVFTTEDYEPGPGCAGGYTGVEGETAAQVIVNVATSCGVSPRVLLTLIQKEQSLLTASGESLSAHDYEAAAGYDCPDGGTCDPEHAGFFRQVYGAAAQFQRYHQDPQAYEVIAGETATLGYAPTAACGTGEVTPLNQATAGLYNYTPYLLNDAAWDGGDACTTWGTLNFYGYYRTWFGDPTPSTAD